MQKGTWSKEEDKIVRDMVTTYGVGSVKWSSIAEQVSVVDIFKHHRMFLLLLVNSYSKSIIYISFQDESGNSAESDGLIT